MKKIISIILVPLLLIIPVLSNSVYANTNNRIITVTNIDKELQEVNRGEIFNYFASFFRSYTPDSYKYIQLNYKDTKKGTQLYDSLQILVYYNVIENTESYVFSDKKLKTYSFLALSKIILGIEFFPGINVKLSKKRYTNKNDLKLIKDEYLREIKSNRKISIDKELETKKEIFDDVFSTLTKEHYDKDKTTKKQLLNSAIEGLAKGTGDKFTTYFPPTETKDFQDSLSGEFEGIGSYVDMEKPGLFKIISPITGSPSYKAGLKGGDIVTHVDGKEVTKETSAGEVISWIKGPKGTKVTLTINRSGKILIIDVIRDKIVIKDIETKLLNRNTFEIKISNFGPKVSSEFKKALIELKSNRNIKKVIIDLRNNGGGYLDQVTKMLSYMVPEGKPTAIIKYINGDKIYKSAGYELINFSKYKIIVLQNSGTASASEILAGTIKDYYPESISIGEQSYGKGSVQQMRQYKDGSLLKYTVARWYTGGSETSISGVGLTPDIKLEIDIELYKKNGTDNQLEKAIKIK